MPTAAPKVTCHMAGAEGQARPGELARFYKTRPSIHSSRNAIAPSVPSLRMVCGMFGRSFTDQLNARPQRALLSNTFQSAWYDKDVLHFWERKSVKGGSVRAVGPSKSWNDLNDTLTTSPLNSRSRLHRSACARTVPVRLCKRKY